MGSFNLDASKLVVITTWMCKGNSNMTKHAGSPVTAVMPTLLKLLCNDVDATNH